MGAGPSKKQRIHDAIHLSGVPVTAISNDGTHISSQTVTSQHPIKKKRSTKWMSFGIFSHMRHITAAINLAEPVATDDTTYTPHSIYTPTDDGEGVTNNRDWTPIKMRSDHDEKEEIEDDDINTKEIETSISIPPTPTIPKVSTKVMIQDTESTKQEKQTMSTKGKKEELLVHHKCWFIGNNQYGQFGDDFVTENLLELSLMNGLPSDIHINHITTTYNGSIRVLYDGDKSMIIAGRNNNSNQLNNGHSDNRNHDQCDTNHIKIIFHHWSHHQYTDPPENISELITLYLNENTMTNTKTKGFTPPAAIIAPDLTGFDTKIISGGITSNHLLILTQNNELYAVNNDNQCDMRTPGFGSSPDMGLKRIGFFENNDIKLKQIESTSYGTIFLSEMGKLYSSDRIGKDGEDNITLFDYNQIKLEITNICCGADHTLATTINGNVYSFGFNGCGQLGQGINCKFAVYEPTLIQYLIDNNIHIINISCGAYHNILLDIYGNIYCFGLNNHYQCGNNDTQNVYLPQLNETLKLNNIRVIDIKCGYQHNVIYTDKDDYWLWGDNEFNQCLVYDENIKHVKIPMLYNCLGDIYKYFFPGEIVTIYPGWKETRIITT